MTCEIRVSTKHNVGNDESLFSVNDGSPDQAGAIVAIIARKALEGQICRDRYDVFENILEWFETKCPNWELLPELGRGCEIIYYYHIKLDNDREGNLEVEIGFSQRGLPVRYVTVNEFVKDVNRVRREMNSIFERCQLIPGLSGRQPARMLRKVKDS